MKKKIFNTTIILVILFFGACDSYLDRTPDDQMTEDQVFTRYERTSQLVNDLYEAAKHANSPLVFFNHFSTMGITDEGEAASLVEGEITHKFNEGSWNPDGMPDRSDHGEYWNSLYNRIRRTNVILAGVNKYNTPDNIMRPGELRERIGEVFFMRAYFHYLLIRMYGEAVYMDYLPDPNAEMRFSKQSFHYMVDKINQDCDSAFNRLPNIQPESYFCRADQGAVLGLKAAVAWMAATPMWNGGNFPGKGRVHEGEYIYKQERWEKAKAAAKAVLDFKIDGAPRFNLYTKFTDTDFGDDEGKNMSNSKVYHRLWEMYHDVRDGLRQEGLFVIERTKNDAWQGDQYPASRRNGGSRNQPVQEQVDEYEFIGPDGYGYPIYHPKAKEMGYDDENPYEGIKRDPRFYRDVLYHGATFRDANNNTYKINASEGPDRIVRNKEAGTRTGYWTRKFLKESWNGNKSFSLSCPPVWSLPEMIYIYCEAVNETTGPNNEIYELLNKVRARSFMAPIPLEAKTNKELMNEYIQRERRVELFYQDNRVWATRLYLDANNSKELAKEQAWESAATTDDERSQKYWPYPKCQRMVNGMMPVEDPNGKIEVNGKKFKMKRFCVERRVFETPKHYLFPIMDAELKRTPELVQNPGW